MADIMKVDNVYFYYGENREFKIIDGVSFGTQRGEFLSIIGPSGCGKSTLLRIMAGLIKAGSGRVLFNGKQITEPNKEISFVFQDFALMPWLTNVENVKLGLSLLDWDDDRKEKRARELLGQFGLAGFEDSYPNMLRGGMKQRVGIARAIASNPTVLLMDEPFSSLDELTANTLRDDVVYLLRSKKISVNSIIMVTHNVEEAVQLSDRIVVLTNKPSKVKRIEKIDMKFPRDKHSKQFLTKVDGILADLVQ
jgi:NitT/TauT family transport system ATP-binding protein